MYTIGLLTGFCLVSLYFVFSSLIEPVPKEQSTTVSTRFAVVDEYKNCDVVRYTAPGQSKYHYFLDCSK